MSIAIVTEELVGVDIDRQQAIAVSKLLNALEVSEAYREVRGFDEVRNSGNKFSLESTVLIMTDVFELTARRSLPNPPSWICQYDLLFKSLNVTLHEVIEHFDTYGWKHKGTTGLLSVIILVDALDPITRETISSSLGINEFGSRRRPTVVLAIPLGSEKRRMDTARILEALGERLATSDEGNVKLRDVEAAFPGATLFTMEHEFDSNDREDEHSTQLFLAEAREAIVGGAREPANEGGTQRVWFGTNRRLLDRAMRYGCSRGLSVHYGYCDVTIPKSHRIGGSTTLWRRILGLVDTPIVSAICELSQEGFWSGVVDGLEVVEPQDRSALVFLHGYNVSFEEAAIATAQLAADLQFPGIAVFYSWPSAGKLHHYLADSAAIEASERHIADFLADLLQRVRGAKVHVIAHSMGNRGLLAALPRILGRLPKAMRRRIDQLILAAPDLDRETFLERIKACPAIVGRTTIYVSERDRALRMSGFLHQFARAGLCPPVTVALNADTIDAGATDLSLLGHGYVLSARDVIYDLFYLIRHDYPPEKRAALKLRTTPGGERYWKIAE